MILSFSRSVKNLQWIPLVKMPKLLAGPLCEIVGQLLIVAAQLGHLTSLASTKKIDEPFSKNA